jgi:two-component system, chemotaxis family, CheB/CheR fusion protein
MVGGVIPDFPIVGIGASAGGLAAFEAFFSGMPADIAPGMAFVLVQHLDPNHKSILSDLIKRYTRMEVYEVEDGMMVQPNCAYIIPPGRDMAFLGGSLHLLEPVAPRGQRLPIDFFFRSLAGDQHERAICIVLSGTGSDGSLGVRMVKGEGGMVMAQSPESTEYDGMPRSAIATGLVDYILTPAEMPAQLIAYAAHAFGKAPPRAIPPTSRVEDNLKKICVLLRDQTGHDFSQYKQNTLIRRVERRMAVHQIERPEDYLRYLRQTPVEAQALFRDLLIGVTNFFRDPEAFAVLETQVVPQLFTDKPAGAPVRVWICGCATGEEAYSIAILLQEYLETIKRTFKVQVFATDIDPRAIEQARTGVFPVSIVTDLSSDRLARFFIQESDGAYRIQKVIRDLLVFSEQDVIKDPPFSKIDLISCRNLLIYLNGELQKKLIPLFHYALNPKGVLFLGTSESVGDFGALFSTLDRKQKLYRHREDLPGTARPSLNRFVPPLTETLNRGRGVNVDLGRPNLRLLTEHTLLTHYAETGVLINGLGDILYIYGRTGKYLEPAAGDAGMNILTMAREGLRPALTTALYKVVARKEPVIHSGLRVKTNGDFTAVDLSLRPALDSGGAALPDMFLVILKESTVPPDLPDVASRVSDTDSPGAAVTGENRRIAALEQELRNKEEYLQSTLEEMETSNEELKSTNEEMQSVNEELQSTNEELETSKEELQSVNEELATVNAELQNKVTDLSRANNDMNNLLAGTGIATLFVDHQLRIVRFTPSATEMINLIQSDIGRPVAHIVSNLADYDSLVADVQAVLHDLVPREVEVQTRKGVWFLMRIRPYRTLENVIEGAVITFTDVTRNKQAWKMLKERECELNAILKSMFSAYAQFESVFDGDGNFVSGRFVSVNDTYERVMDVTNLQVHGKTLHEVWPGIEAAWIETCNKVVTSGMPNHFDMSHARTGKWYRCRVSRSGEGPERFFIIFDALINQQAEINSMGPAGKAL